MRRRHPSWGAIADAVGHCVLVFAFVPTLAALPRWLSFEASHSESLHAPIALAFLPMRAGLALEEAFADGVTQGVFAGVLAGVLLAVRHVRRGAATHPVRRALEGAVCGALGAAIMVATILSVQLLGGALRVPMAAVAFEIASGLVCGVLAAPHAFRLLGAGAAADVVVAAAPSPRP